jgi:class 3 adenylate cyclase
MGSKINEDVLEGKLEELEKARTWSPRVISKLEGLIRSGDDYSIFRVNPLKFGSEKNISEQEVIDLFLYGSKCGIFNMNWQLLCPGCGDVVESFSTLRYLDSNYHCDLCQKDFEAALDDYIEISFTISPSIREIIFHSPETLPIEDYFFNYVFSQGAKFPDGTKFVDLVKKSVKIISYLEPRQGKKFELEIPPGFLVGCDRLNHGEFFFDVKGEYKPEIQHFSFKLIDGQYEPGKGELTPGKYVFNFENQTNRRGAVLLIYKPYDFTPPGPLLYEPFLSGKRLLTTQTFRDLFRSEIVQGNEGIGVKDITILFTDLKGSTALYDRIGDLKAFALVRQHFDSLGKVVNSHYGAVVKTIGDAVMATFLNPLDAVKAALSMLDEIKRFNQEHGMRDLILKIGIHKGAAIAVTLNDRLDYFGQTVNISSRVEKLSDAEEIHITLEVYNYPGVQDLLDGLEIDLRKAKLKGVQEEMRVYKVSSGMRKMY